MTIRRFVWVCAAVAVVACAPRGASVRTSALAPPPLVASSTPTMPALVDAIAAAARAGAGRAARVAEGVLFEGERVGAFVEVPDDECVLVLARGASTVADLDLVLWSDEGEWLAGDERRDSNPSVFLCPPHPSRLHAMGMMAAGRGAVSISAQRVSRADESRVRAWLATLRPGVEGGDGRAHRTLVHASADAPVLVPMLLEAQACAEVRAAGSGASTDPDLTLIDDSGTVLRRGSSEDSDAAVLRFCATEAFRGHLVVRSRLGQSDVVVTVHRALRTAWEGEGRRVDPLARAGELRLPSTMTFLRDAEPQSVASLVERGLARVGEGSREVQVIRGVGGTPVTVPGVSSASGGATVVVVRSERRRFSVKAMTVEGARRYHVTGVGEASFATPSLAHEVVLELDGLPDGEPFLVLVAR